MGRKHYFIDTENIGLEWLGVVPANEDNEIVMFVSKNTNMKVPLMLVAKIHNNYKHIRYIECKTLGIKNAMDFIIVSSVSYTAAKAPDNGQDEYIIVSNDHGYDVCVERLKELGANVTRIAVTKDLIESYESDKEAHPISLNSDKSVYRYTGNALRALIGNTGIPRCELNTVTEIVSNSKSKKSITNLEMSVLSKLVSTYGENKGTHYFKLLKAKKALT